MASKDVSVKFIWILFLVGGSKVVYSRLYIYQLMLMNIGLPGVLSEDGSVIVYFSRNIKVFVLSFWVLPRTFFFF